MFVDRYATFVRFMLHRCWIGGDSESMQQSFAEVMRVYDLTCIILLEGKGYTSSGGVELILHRC